MDITKNLARIMDYLYIKLQLNCMKTHKQNAGTMYNVWIIKYVFIILSLFSVPACPLKSPNIYW